MRNKYKKTLAKIAAIFSIIAVFSFGFMVSKSYAMDAESGNNIAGQNIEDINDEEFKEFLNEGEVSEIQDGAESPYYQAITQDHLDSAKAISGESSDNFQKMFKTYEAQENLRAALKAKKENPYDSSHDARIADARAQHKDAYGEHYEVNQKAIPNLVERAEYLERKKGRTEEDNKKLAQYRSLTMSSGSTPAESPATNSLRQLGKSQEKLNEAERRYNILGENDPNKAQAKKEYSEIEAMHYALGKLYREQADLERGRSGASEEKVKSAESAYKDIVTKVKNGTAEISVGNQNKALSSIDQDRSAANILNHLYVAQKKMLATEQRYEYLSENNAPETEQARKNYEEAKEIHSALGKLYREQADLENGWKGSSEERVRKAEAEFRIKIKSFAQQENSVNSDSLASSAAPRITPTDIKVLEKMRDTAGAEYSKNLSLGIDDFAKADAAEELFKTGKKLLSIQEKLDKAISFRDRTDKSNVKFQERANKVDALEKEHDALQEKYYNLRLTSGLPVETIIQKKNGSMDMVTPEIQPTFASFISSPKPKVDIGGQTTAIAVDEKGDYIAVVKENKMQKSEASKVIVVKKHHSSKLPISGAAIPKPSTNSTEVKGLIKNDWKADILNDALSQ